MAKYLGVPLEISNGNKIPRNGQPNIAKNPEFLGEETVNGNYKSIQNWRIQADPVVGFLSGFTPLNEVAENTFPNNENIVATISNVGGNYVDLQAMDNSGAVDSNVFEIGKAYEVTYTVWSSSSDRDLMMSVSGDNVEIPTKSGTNRYSFIARQEYFKFFRNFNLSSVFVIVSNISIKEIAATETPTYNAPQLIPNSHFTSNSDWTPSNSGVSISQNHLTYSSAVNETYASTDTTVFEKFKRYVVEIDIESITGDNPRIRVVAGGDPNTYSDYYGSPGVYTHTFTAIGNSTNGRINVYLYTDSTASALVNSVTLYEEPYLIGTSEILKDNSFNLNNDSWSFNSNTGWSISDGKAIRSGYGTNSKIWQNIPVEAGKSYKFSYTRTYQSGDGQTNIFTALDGVPGNQSTFGILDSTVVGEETVEGFFAVSFTGDLEFNIYGINDFTGSISNASVTEVEYNYLQVDDANFKGLIKKGDVVFNTSTNTEGVVKEVIDDNVLLMSNDNFSAPGEFFSAFASNNDTRGNQILKIDDLVAFDYEIPNGSGLKSGFWFSGAKDATKLSLYSISDSYETEFTSKVIEEYIERLDAQSATNNRLDIPLDKFRDGNSVTAINDIRIS